MSPMTNRKKLFLVIGGGLLVLVVLTGLEGLLPRATRAPAADGRDPSAAGEPLRPTLVREDDKTILIEAGTFHHSRFRYGEDDSVEEVDELYRCLEEGIAREFDDTPTSRNSEVRTRMGRISDACMGRTLELPELPEAR